MYTLYFVIILSSGNIIKEQFDNSFTSHDECKITGWNRANAYTDQIKDKYPDIDGFDVECSRLLKIWIRSSQQR